MTRMLRLTAMVATAAMLAMVGCDLDQQHEIGHMPPPGYQAEMGEPMPIERATGVEPVEPQPMPPTGSASESPEVVEVAPSIVPEPVDDGVTTYTVREGDTLWAIAESVYGDGQRWEDIIEANPEVEPEGLRVGQELTLP